MPIGTGERTVKAFELKRPYVIRQHGRLYTIVNDVHRGSIAYPAVVEGRASGTASSPKRSAHATKVTRDKTSDKINIDEVAKLLGLPDWDRITELNQDHYWEMSRGAPDEEAEMKAQHEAEEDVYAQWYDAVEHTADNLFGEHGLEIHPTGKQGTEKRRYDFKIVPQTSWKDAAEKIRETINGVGDFHFDDLAEFLRSGPYTARQAVLAHLGYIKRYPAVYGGLGANQMYEQHWR